MQLVKKFPAFHGTRRFITAFTSVRHLSLSWANPIQNIDLSSCIIVYCLNDVKFLKVRYKFVYFSIVSKSYTFRYRPLSNQECNRAVPILGTLLFLLYFNHTDICPFLSLRLECTLTIFKVRNNTSKWRICGCVNIALKRDTFLWEIRE